MKLFVQVPIGPQSGLAEINVIPEHTVGEVKQHVCTSFGVDASSTALMYGGIILDEKAPLSRLGVPENGQLALMPYTIVGG